MDNTNPKRHKQSNRELIVIGAVVGVLASSLYDMFKSLLAQDLASFQRDWIAAIIVATIFAIILKYGLGSETDEN